MISVITVWTDPMHESLVLIVYALKPHMNAYSNSARLDDLFYGLLLYFVHKRSESSGETAYMY